MAVHSLVFYNEAFYGYCHYKTEDSANYGKTLNRVRTLAYLSNMNNESNKFSATNVFCMFTHQNLKL
jgi:hypothetical protein